MGGNTNTSFTPLDNYNILLYNTNEKQFPPRIWDIAPVAEVPSSNEIFNIIPLSYQRQQFSLNNHGTYTIYSSTTWNSTLGNSKANLFDYNLTETTEYGATWKPDNYANGVLAAVANTYTIGLNNSYRGDWIIVKFPFPIILTRFRFYRRNDIIDRSPGFWKCYGSNDGVNWTEITEASHIPPSLSIATYTTTNDGSSYYYQKIVSNLDIPYLYIGWVVNQLAGTNVLANCINFSELQIFGKDDISNSYSNVWNKSNTKIFNTLGNIGIGTTNPQYKLDIYDSNINSGFLRIQGIGGVGSYAGIIINSWFGRELYPMTQIYTIDNGNGSGDLTFAIAEDGSITSSLVERMRIKSNGNIGIGTNNPQYKLDVNGTGYLNSSAWSYSSDYRIKTNINDINDDNALLKILAIQPKTYEYIDKEERGSNIVYGFIAQQIEEIIPEAVNIQEQAIPNIYKSFPITSNIITLDNLYGLNINDKINIRNNNNLQNFTIIDINEETNEITIDKEIEATECFVYGTTVNDFHALKKEYIFTLNVCATQELYKLIQAQQQQINNLLERISILESKQ